jgi:hypothetical protein
MGIDKRIEDLERLIKPASPEDEGAQLRRAVMVDILDELSSLTSCRSTNSYRGGKPPTPIQPTDPTGEALGYPYTTGQLTEYAIRRVLERRRPVRGDPDALSEEAALEELVCGWSASWRRLFFEERGHGWEETWAEEPPGRTRPWRGGS